MTAELAVRDVTGTPAELPDLQEAMGVFRALIEAGANDELDEARRRAEAYALYEKRAGHLERERHFAMLRLLSEAALGVLSFDDANIVPSKPAKSNWRALASAFERGKLLLVLKDTMKSRPLTTPEVVSVLRYHGYTYVPGQAVGRSRKESLRWIDGRRIAKQDGIELETLPADARYAQRRAQIAEKQSRRMLRRELALQRLERMEARQRTITDAKTADNRLSAGYADLRRAIQAVHDAQASVPLYAKEELDSLVFTLYRAEDMLGPLIRASVEWEQRKRAKE